MAEEDDLSFEALTFGASERDKNRLEKYSEQDDTEEEQFHEIAANNVILVHTSYGGKINPVQIIEYAQKHGGKVINFNFREKQCFGFLQLEEDAAVDRLLEVMNDAVIDGTHVNAERCAGITAGRDPRTHNSDSDYKNSTLVLKNLPFQLKQERLEEILNTVDAKPINVSYLYDNNGMFRGMAFVKYKEIGHGTKVFQSLNGMDINGRKLRIEYKRKVKEASVLQEDDVNHLHEQLIQFTTSPLTELSFPCVSSYQRKQIHQFAERLGLGHYSTGEGENRYVLVKKRDPETSSHPSSFNGNNGSFMNSLAASLGSNSIPISSIASSPASTIPSTSPSKQTQNSGKVRRRSDLNANGPNMKNNWENKSPQNEYSGPISDRQKASQSRNSYANNGPGAIGGHSGFYGNSGMTPPYNSSAMNNGSFTQALYSSSPAFPSYHGNQVNSSNGTSSISGFSGMIPPTGISPGNYYGNVHNGSPHGYLPNGNTNSLHSNHISSSSFGTPPTIGFSSNFHSHFGPNYSTNSNSTNVYNASTPPMYVASNGSFSGSPFSQFGGPSPPFRKSSMNTRNPNSEVRQPKGPDGTGGFGSDYQRSRKAMGPPTPGDANQNTPWTLFGSSAPLFTMTSGLESLRGQTQTDRREDRSYN